MLALLAIEGERSPYDLMKCVSGAIGYIWAPAKTQLYAILPRLERDGLASSRSAREGGRPEKQLYSLTPAGRRALDAWLAEEPGSTDAFYLKLFVGKLAPAEVLRGHLQWFRETTCAQLEQFRALEQIEQPDRARPVPLVPAPPRARARGAPARVDGLGRARAGGRGDVRRLALLAVAGALVAAPAAAQAPSGAGDVRELAASLREFHPRPFHSVSRARFDAAVQRATTEAPSLSRNELVVELMRIAALIGDRNGHSGIFPGDPQHRTQLHLYPIRLYTFDDGTYVVDAVERDLVGAKLVSIADVPLATVFGARPAARAARQLDEPQGVSAPLRPDRGGPRRPARRRGRRREGVPLRAERHRARAHADAARRAAVLAPLRGQRLPLPVRSCRAAPPRCTSPTHARRPG